MIRKTIAGLAGYTPGEQPDPSLRVIKLNTNENPYPPSPAALEALTSVTGDLLKVYPNADSRPVREAAADLLGVHPDEVIVGNGSDDILTILNRLTLEAGMHSAAMTPTYTLYRVLAKLQDAELTELPFGTNFTISQEFIHDPAPLKLVPNPNAPTGTLISKDDIRTLAEKSSGIVVIDEAYIDFAPEGSSAVNLINDYPNLVVTRTLSKSWSLAGLRLGLGIAHRELIGHMHKIRDSYNVDIISQKVAEAALRDPEWMRENARKVIATREFLDSELTKRGWATIGSHANFILAEPPSSYEKEGKSAQELYQYLKSQNILVRHFKDPEVSRYLRISIGSDDECRELLAVLDAQS